MVQLKFSLAASFLALVLVLLLTSPVWAQQPATLTSLRACGLTAGPVLKVRDVIDGDTLVVEDGREVRIVGIQAPKLPLGRRGFEPWPLAVQAKKALEELTQGKSVRLMHSGNREDRHGRILAHLLVLENPLEATHGLWLEQAMLAQGMARVYSFRDNRACITELLAFEREARAESAGIWSEPFYRVRQVAETKDLIDTFQVIEGRVIGTARRSEGIYLNFGTDWSTDTTVFVAKRDIKRFEKAEMDLLSLESRTIRVRGWLDLRNGPMIELTHPEQVELVEGSQAE